MNKEISLNFNTLRKLINKQTNKLLDDVIENVSCCSDNHSLLGVAREILGYIDNECEDFEKLCEQLSMDLKDYTDVVCFDENCLTNEGYDFLVLFIHKEINDFDFEEYRREVGF